MPRRPHECLVTLKPSLNILLYIYQITYLFISNFAITHFPALGRHMDCLMTLACLLSPELFPAMASTHYKEIIDAFFSKEWILDDSLDLLHDLKMNDKTFSKKLWLKNSSRYWFTKIPEPVLRALVTYSGNVGDTHYSICCFSKPIIWEDVYNNCFSWSPAELIKVIYRNQKERDITSNHWW